MAKKKADNEAAEQQPETAPEAPQTGNGESVQGYFRPIFRENPGLLKERSNDFLYQKWLSDHPGETEVPERVKQGLSNLKTVLRKKLGSKRGPKPKNEQPAQEAAQTTAPRRATAQLEQLEHSIDESLSLAKHIDREGLHEVIRHLRAARNRVVIQMGGE